MINILGMEGKVLLFNIEKDKMESIAALCTKYGVIPVIASDEDQNKELGELVGFHKDIVGVKTDMTATFSDEMMVFSMVTGLDSFLDDYKKMGIAPIPLKAVLTPSNMKWTAAKLHKELKREHETLHFFGKN